MKSAISWYRGRVVASDGVIFYTLAAFPHLLAMLIPARQNACRHILNVEGVLYQWAYNPTGFVASQ